MLPHGGVPPVPRLAPLPPMVLPRRGEDAARLPCPTPAVVLLSIPLSPSRSP